MELIHQSNIKKYYKTIGYINLGFSILLAFIINDIDFKDRIIAVITINIGYHMLYLFFSNLSKDSSRMHNSFNNIMGTSMLKLFSVFGIVTAFVSIYFIISNTIIEKDYLGLFGICIPFSLFLGAYNLWLDLNKV